MKATDTLNESKTMNEKLLTDDQNEMVNRLMILGDSRDLAIATAIKHKPREATELENLMYS